MWEHFVKMDGIVNSYKGVVKTDKPIFSVERRVARTNKFKSVEYVWEAGKFVSTLPEIHPAFKLDLAATHEDGLQDEQVEYYDGEQDPEAEFDYETDPEELGKYGFVKAKS